MANTSTFQDNGADATLAKWPGKFGGYSGNVNGGQIQLLSTVGATSTSLNTDIAAAPLALDYLEAELSMDRLGTSGVLTWAISNTTSGTQIGFNLRVNGNVEAINQVGFADVTGNVVATTLVANTKIRVAIALGASATRYGVSSPVSTSLYYLTAPAGSSTWTLVRTDVAANVPGWVTACRIIASTFNSGGTTTAWIDNVNLISTGAVATAPSAPTGVVAARSATDSTLATVTWTAPTSTGGSTITGYTVSRDGVDSAGFGTYTTTLPASLPMRFTFNDLTTSSFNISVAAVNAVGTSTAVSVNIPAYVPSTLPKLGNIADDFNDNSFDTSVWTTISPGISDQNGGVYVDAATSTPKYLLTQGDMTGQRIFMKMTPASFTTAGDALMLLMRSTVDRSQVVRIYTKDGVLYGANDAGSPDTLQSGTPYSAATMTYWSIRHDATAGKVYLEYSADRVTWTALARSGFTAPSWIASVEAGICVQNLATAPSAASVPTVPTAFVASMNSDGVSATLTWNAPTSDGGSPVTVYTFGRDGQSSTGAGPYQATQSSSTSSASGTTVGTSFSVVFYSLVPGATYNVYVYASNANGSGPQAVQTITVPGTATPPVTTGTWDWAADFTSRTTFENDFIADGASHKDWAGTNWVPARTDPWYPWSFLTESGAPSGGTGKFVRAFCDKATLHPTSPNGGLAYIGGAVISKRSWTSGYLEWAVRFPSAGSGNGGFPAPAWLYASRTSGSQTDNTGTFTAVAATGSQEIDVCEVGGTAFTYDSTCHSTASVNHNFVHSTFPADQWHTWGLEWGASSLKVYFDRVLVGTHDSTHTNGTDANAFDGVQMALHLNYATGGWTKPVDSTTPASLWFDLAYIRHFAARPF